jgi:hypothetical protein
MIFVNRDAEMAELDRVLARPEPQLVRIYGRRRVGKTALLQRLVARHGGLYLLADEADRPQQLESLDRQIALQTQGLRMPLREWDDFYDRIDEERPGVVVIDEFQRLLERDRQAATRLQARWDAAWHETGPSVILCGSSIGMMERLTAGKRGPLFGRLTGNLRLKHFDYTAVRLLYPELSEEERVRRFSVFGGTPAYHEPGLRSALKTAVVDAFLAPTAPLLEEPQELLRLELKSPTRYNSVLYEIGNGRRSLNELETSVRVSPGGLGPYMDVLRHDLDLVEMDDPVGGKRRQARYRLTDPFFEFYFKFIFSNRPRIELGRGPDVWKDIKMNLETHVGLVFERVVRDLLVALNGRKIKDHQLDFDEIGRWWDRTGREIDLVARGPRELWAIEVKWSRHPVGIDVWNRLVENAALVDSAKNVRVRPVVVARGGFDDRLSEEARKRGGLLLTFDDVTQALESR